MIIADKMEYASTIVVACDKPTLLKRAFSAELSNPKRDRSKWSIKQAGKKIEFKIKAKDAVALRATLDSIAKLLIVYEKLGSLK